MTAIHDNKIYNVAEASGPLFLETRAGEQLVVDYDDERLIVDPTDADVVGASNLAEWYRLDTAGIEQLRSMLRGEITLSDWQERRALEA